MHTLKKICLTMLLLQAFVFVTPPHKAHAFEQQGQAPNSSEELIDNVATMGFHMGVITACGNTVNIHSNETIVRAFMKKFFAYHNKKGINNKELGKILKENIQQGKASINKDKAFAFCWRSAANLEQAYGFFGLRDANLTKIGQANYPIQ